MLEMRSRQSFPLLDEQWVTGDACSCYLPLSLGAATHIACLLGHIQMSSIVDRWYCGILGAQLEILTPIYLVWQLCELNGQQ